MTSCHGSRIRHVEEIETDIREMPVWFCTPERIFLQDADDFAADYDTLMRVAGLLREHVPSVESIDEHARLPLFCVEMACACGGASTGAHR